MITKGLLWIFKKNIPPKIKKIIDKIGDKVVCQVIDIIKYDNILALKGAIKNMDKKKILSIVDKIGEDKILKIINLIGIKNIVEIALDFIDDKQ